MMARTKKPRWIKVDDDSRPNVIFDYGTLSIGQTGRRFYVLHRRFGVGISKHPAMRIVTIAKKAAEAIVANDFVRSWLESIPEDGSIDLNSNECQAARLAIHTIIGNIIASDPKGNK